MKWAVIMLLVVGLGVAGVVFVPRYLEARAKAALKSKCDALREQLAVLRTQGGDVSQAEQIEAQLRLCLADAKAAGVDIDADAIELGECEDLARQIDEEWAAYKSTAGEDAVKRNNAFHQVHRLCDALVTCLSAQIEAATTPERLRAVRDIIVKAQASSILRYNCLAPDGALGPGSKTGSGCSRVGVNEPDQSEKWNEERTRGLEPLRTLNERASLKLAELDASFAAQRAQAHSNAEQIAGAVVHSLGGVAA